MSDCKHGYDGGAYVLGALAPADRGAYERHLLSCPPCRDAVAEFAVLPGLLRRLDAADLVRLMPPAPSSDSPALSSPRSVVASRSVASSPESRSRLPALLAAAAAWRRRELSVRRWRYAAVALAAAGLALFAGIGGPRLAGGEAGPPGPAGTIGPAPASVPMVAMRPVATGSPVAAKIGLRSTGWGTEVTMRCTYGAGDRYAGTYVFRLVARGRDGISEQVGSWTAGPGDEVRVTGTVRLAGPDLVRLELTRADGTALLRYDP